MGKVALELQQGCPDLRDLSDDRGLVADTGCAQALIIELRWVECGGRPDIFQPFASGEAIAGDGTIEQTGIQARIAEMRSNAAGEGALARCRWPINGNDHSWPLLFARM
jgi:hypothetical protein